MIASEANTTHWNNQEYLDELFSSRNIMKIEVEYGIMNKLTDNDLLKAMALLK